MNKKIKFLLCIILVSTSVASAQVSLTRNYFYDLQAYNFLDFDFENGSNNPNFFSYTLSYQSPDNEPADIIIEISLTATLPAFGFQNTNMVHVRSKPFEFLGTFNITSLDIDQNLDKAYYSDRNEEIDYHGNEIEEFIPESEFNKIRDNVLATGELPVGQYVFTIKVFEDGMLVGDDQKIISIASSNRLELIEPGGELADNIEIQTTFPIFRWDSEPVRYDEEYCSECGLYLRVAEYNPDQHSSLQEALNDLSTLPFPDNHKFAKLNAISNGQGTKETVNNFIYPTSGANSLQKGHYYVWQLKKKYPTTAGFDEIESEIFVFKVADEENSDVGNAEMQLVNELIFKLIENVNPDDIEEFRKELENYSFSGDILIGNQTITSDELKVIFDKINSEDYKLETIIIK